MRYRYLIYCGFLIPFSSLAQTSEYIPPPTGPYQSSVVINTLQSGAVDEAQVYKFPTADLIEQDKDIPEDIEVRSIPTDLDFPSEQDIAKLRDRNDMKNSPQSAPLVPENRPGSEVMESQQTLPVNPAYDVQSYTNTVNPWSSSQVPYPNAYQEKNVWAQPRSRGQYQYPYGYPQQYNNTYNSPYDYMPTPWSMMPKNPFFQGN